MQLLDLFGPIALGLLTAAAAWLVFDLTTSLLHSALGWKILFYCTPPTDYNLFNSEMMNQN